MATLITASPTKVSGQTFFRSSSLVTSWPGRATSWLRTANALGLSLITLGPRHRHSLVRSRQKGSKIIRFSLSTAGPHKGYKNWPQADHSERTSALFSFQHG